MANLLRKLEHTLRFLLFLEEDPKHQVVENTFWIHLMLFVLTPLVLGVGYLMFLFYAAWGALGFLIAYLAVCIVTIEIPHILLDR